MSSLRIARARARTRVGLSLWRFRGFSPAIAVIQPREAPVNSGSKPRYQCGLPSENVRYFCAIYGLLARQIHGFLSIFDFPIPGPIQLLP